MDLPVVVNAKYLVGSQLLIVPISNNLGRTKKRDAMVVWTGSAFCGGCWRRLPAPRYLHKPNCAPSKRECLSQASSTPIVEVRNRKNGMILGMREEKGSEGSTSVPDLRGGGKGNAGYAAVVTRSLVDLRCVDR